MFWTLVLIELKPWCKLDIYPSAHRGSYRLEVPVAAEAEEGAADLVGDDEGKAHLDHAAELVTVGALER